MDVLDLFFFVGQEQRLQELRQSLTTAGVSTKSLLSRQAQAIELLQQENDDLRLRLAVLLRCLVAQGTISKEQFDAELNEARLRIAQDTARLQPPITKAKAKVARNQSPTVSGRLAGPRRPPQNIGDATR